jgi:hypothetical protein
MHWLNERDYPCMVSSSPKPPFLHSSPQVALLYQVTEPKQVRHEWEGVRHHQSPLRPNAFSRIGSMTRNIASTAVAGGQMVLRRGKKRGGQSQPSIACGPPKPQPGIYNGQFEGEQRSFPHHRCLSALTHSFFHLFIVTCLTGRYDLDNPTKCMASGEIVASSPAGEPRT